ncbi:lipocalin family protein [Acidisoma silvae]|uniref:Outer membrane lipoprotein Blc n=1 Tax=Acidisoma silvae TaxID=2802396 RepID=A0A964DXY0_9PROT|nr:lipocalin family protein [Acidisoma silvae]MCB8874517.1 lipocalin family protein [Acidisoma silvae]
MTGGRQPDRQRRGGVSKLALAGLALLIAGLGVVSARPRRQNRPPPPRPRKAVDLEQYLGRWYEFARYTAWFERGAEAVTAEYSLRPDGLIRVVNISHQGGPAGPLRWAEAKARPVAGSNNAKLKVAFFGPVFLGDYWVLDHADDYAWSIVGEGSRRYLWILTRDPFPSAETQTLLLSRVQSFGYDLSRLHMTVHASA